MGYTLNEIREIADELKRKSEELKKRLERANLIPKKLEKINEGLKQISKVQDSAIQNLKSINNNNVKKIEVKQKIVFKSILELRKEIEFCSWREKDE